VTLLVILFTVSLSSCSFRTTTQSNYKAKRIPPGHAKINGNKVLNTNQVILKKDRFRSESVFFLSLFNSNSGTLFIEKYQYSYIEIAISATLKMALKVKSLPPQIGNQLGRLPFQMGNKTYQLLYRENSAIRLF
jgi:hypothetical protein